jgi:hypothetical protein
MSPRRLTVALLFCATLMAICAWSFWWPSRTFSDDRGILQREHIDYGAGIGNSTSAASSTYKLRFLRASDEKVRVDFNITVENERRKPLNTACYYLVPPGSELLDTSKLDPKLADPDGDGSITVTGDDMAKWEVPFFNMKNVDLLHKYDDQGFWMYDQPCAVAAAPHPETAGATTSSSSEYGASFSIPSNVFFRTAYRTYELDFDLQGVPVFSYAGDQLPSGDVVNEVSWVGNVTYELDGKGWPVTSRVPDGHQLVTATTSMAAYQITPDNSLDSPALSHPNFTMQGETNALRFTMVQILSTLLLGVIADRVFEAMRTFTGAGLTEMPRQGSARKRSGSPAQSPRGGHAVAQRHGPTKPKPKARRPKTKRKKK